MKVPTAKGVKGEFNDWVNLLVPILTTIAIVVIIWRVYKAYKVGANAAGAEVGQLATAVKTGIPSSRVSYIASLGQQLWDEGVSITLWIRDYDEDMFIDAINAMASQKEMELLDKYYKQASGESLKKAVNASFDATDKKKIASENYGWLVQMV